LTEQTAALEKRKEQLEADVLAAVEDRPASAQPALRFWNARLST